MDISLELLSDSYNSYPENEPPLVISYNYGSKWNCNKVFITLGDRTVSVSKQEFVWVLGMLER